MNSRSILRHPRPKRGGFTLVEMVFAFAVVGIMSLIMLPRLQQTMRAHQARQAAVIVAGDLERAFSLAGRYRRPMRLSCVVVSGVCANATYTIADRTGGTVRVRRELRNDGDLGTMTVILAPTPVDIFPSGVSTQPATVTITSGNSTRTVVASTAGRVRILP